MANLSPSELHKNELSSVSHKMGNLVHFRIPYQIKLNTAGFRFILQEISFKMTFLPLNCKFILKSIELC